MKIVKSPSKWKTVFDFFGSKSQIAVGFVLSGFSTAKDMLRRLAHFLHSAEYIDSAEDNEREATPNMASTHKLMIA